jgi:HEAT repeat protein
VSDAQRLRSGSEADVRAAIAEFAARSAPTDEEAVDALLDCLGHAGKAVRCEAAEEAAHLAAIDPRVPPLLVERLDSPDFRVRWGAAFALCRSGRSSGRALDVLLDTLGSDDGDVRWAAAGLIVRFAATVEGRSTAESALTNLVRSGSVLQRKMALYGLRDLGADGHETRVAAQRALRADDRGVRLAALSFLARAGGDEADAEAMARLLDDVDGGVRRAAAAALGRLGNRSATVLTALAAAARSAEPALRRAAAAALLSIEAET